MGSLNFIGGEKGGVGKSVLSRVLAQYFIDQKQPFTGFDTDRSHQSFRRFYEDYASQTVVDRFESLDLIGESFAEDPERSVLVDLAAQTFAPVARWIEESDMFSLFEELGIAVNFWHVIDGSKDSVNLLNHLFDTYGDKPNYILVLNYGRCADFSIFDNSAEKARAEELGATIIAMPKLHEGSMQKIDLHNSSFWKAINNKDAEPEALCLMERQRVKVWLQKMYNTLDTISL